MPELPAPPENWIEDRDKTLRQWKVLAWSGILIMGAMMSVALAVTQQKPRNSSVVTWSGSDELEYMDSVDVVLPLDKGILICFDVKFTGGRAYFAIQDQGGHSLYYSYGTEENSCFEVPYDSQWYFTAINLDDYDGVHVEYRFTLWP